MRIKIKVKAYEEDITPEAAEKSQHFYKGFAQGVRNIAAKCRRQGIDEIWAWCRIEVRATIKEKGLKFTGVARLGGCCYLGKEDFTNTTGYYQDLVDEAIAEAMEARQKHYEETKACKKPSPTKQRQQAT